jgi:cytochrome o ubiquinol oxidase subunit 2
LICNGIHVKASRTLRSALAIVTAAAASGCSLIDSPVLAARGDAAITERNLLFIVTALVLLVVVPVFVLTFLFVWRYRASNPRARYTPQWSRSAPLETAIWLVPAAIVSVIGTLVWHHTHSLDPYRQAAGTPLEVQVIAEDWKWLFIYPEQNIAAVNQLVFPADRPLRLMLTSDTVMNAFYVPGLAGQIYTMAGMRTDLNVSATAPAEFIGRNTQFSGDGFPDQHFAVRAAAPADFDAWVAQARQAPHRLDAAAYAALAKPGGKVPVTLYSGVEPDLFARVIAKYADMNMQHDAATGAAAGAH